MFGFVCLFLYAVLLLQFVFVHMLCMHYAHVAHGRHVCGANPQKGIGHYTILG